MNKLKNWALVILSVLLVVVTGLLFFTGYQLNKEQAELDIKDAQIMQLDRELGIAKSTLLEQKALNERYKQEINEFPQKLQDLIEEHKLVLSSRDETIAELRGKISGGTTTVVVKDKNVNTDVANHPDSNLSDNDQREVIISYLWEDKYNRFSLFDPDIFTSDNESFTYNQHFRLKGWVFQGKDGKLQIKRLELQEVVQDGVDKDGNPNYRALDDASFNIVDSTFEYSVEPEEKSLFSILTFRILGTFDTSLHPGLGLELLNLGEYIDFANVGLSIGVSFDTSDPLNGSLADSSFSAGIHYLFLRPWLDTNLGLGININSMFSDPTVFYISGTLIFGITNPLNIWKDNE